MKGTYKFELEPLEYGPNELDPYISAETLSYHHGKHLKTYVDNLNKVLENHPELQNYSLEKLLYNLNELPKELRKPIRNNGGGVYNHNLYFKLMSKNSKGPQGDFLDAICKAFGSTEEMLAKLKLEALATFGSGWAYVVSDGGGNLSIMQTSNQDTPIPLNLATVLLVDVWEHAYYLQYQNLRAEYFDKFINVINWEKAEELYNNRGNCEY